MKELGTVISDSNQYLEWSAISHPMEGEEFCGDDFLVKQYANSILVAVVDGLGHGREALDASGKALQYLQQYKNESLINLTNHCHEKLRNTRGVVMSLATFDINEDVMSWMGVGNVEGILFRNSDADETSRETILLKGGVVGYKLPQLKASMMTIQPGDTLVFTTDGVGYGYSNEINIKQSTDDIARYIFNHFVNNNDDAQILVARYKAG